MIYLKKTKEFLSPVIVVLVGITTICFWQLEKRTAVEAQTQAVLRLDISTPDRSYLLKEPIPLVFDLSNQTEFPITWSGLLDFGDKINFIVRAANGSETRLNGDRGLDYPTVGTELMESGKHKTATKLIDDWLAMRLFSQSGRYQLRLEFIYSDFSTGEPERKTILTNYIDIEIVAPRGRDFAASEYLKNVLEPAIRNNNWNIELQSRQHFSANFSDSKYWKYKTFELAKKYFSLGQYQNAENAFYSISDIEFFHAREVDSFLRQLATELRRPVPRSKRPIRDANPPVFRELPTGNVRPIPVAPIPPPIVIPQPTLTPQ